MMGNDNGAEQIVNQEIPLTGGRITIGIVRIGDTVHRPSNAASGLVAQLLGRFEALGVTFAPRYLGQDDRGRDMLSYLPGTVPPKWQRFTDDQVGEAARLLRHFHDATRGSELVGSSPVVCHNDSGPNNFVFQDERPIAIIDFDMIAPGDPLEDIGYMAWSWCISSKPERGPTAVQAHQVRLLTDAYGLEAAGRQSVIDAVIERLERNVRFWSERLASGERTMRTVEQIREVIEWSQREREYVMASRAEFEKALG